MTEFLENLSTYKNISQIVTRLLELWPEHEAYCKSRFADDGSDVLARTDEFSALALKLMDSDLDGYLQDYRWMCERFLEEEFYFRRHGNYRLSTFKEAYDEVYNDDNYMSKYVRGILISQVIWDPHAKAFDYFRTEFLTNLPKAARYLEVGPGHGFFLYFASLQKHIDDIVAWDVSKSSIAATTKAIKELGVKKPVNLIEQDVLKAPPEPDSFDGAVISEVLEHLEDPAGALKTLYASLKTGGRIFINVPINSPAPDHIYLWRSTEEFVNFVKAIGFKIHKAEFYPVTGASLERAIKQDLSISCIIIGEK